MTNPDDRWQVSSGTGTASGTVPHAGIKTVNLYHEIGPQPEDATIEQNVPIDQASPPSAVLIKSHVVAHGAKAFRSPAHVAAIRRRETRKIARLIEDLAARADSEDFVVWTHEPLQKLRGLIHKLTEAEEFSDPEHEGNTCEILRQLRDTFLNRGWERYREPAVRGAAVAILQRLAVADEVSADDAYWAMDQLLELGLNPAAGTFFGDGEEEEIPD
ncbi:MAG TPA: hypothetical protein VMY37_35835 [Thermoguttaceae bacterium]|nr:hypothetical protein [Thermoguttaceae bacterium]